MQLINAECQYCGEAVPSSFELCWNCGAAVDGSLPPTREYSPYSPPVSIDEPSRPFRFGLFHLLVFVTSVCVVLACANNEHAMFIAVAVLITNLLGAIVGLIVTNVFRLPNDGSAPPGCYDSEAENRQSAEPETF